MGLRKEDVYINLQGKSKEELAELYFLLKNNNQPLSKNRDLDEFIIYYYNGSNKKLGLEYGIWQYTFAQNKKEVTIDQLKEILQPMELSLNEQLEKAKAEVERLQKAIEEENKPKKGDICLMDNGDYKFIIILKDNDDKIRGLNIKKITDQELINKLNELPK